MFAVRKSPRQQQLEHVVLLAIVTYSYISYTGNQAYQHYHRF